MNPKASELPTTPQRPALRLHYPEAEEDIRYCSAVHNVFHGFRIVNCELNQPISAIFTFVRSYTSYHKMCIYISRSSINLLVCSTIEKRLFDIKEMLRVVCVFNFIDFITRL